MGTSNKWYDEIDRARSENPTLSGLSSESQTAEFRQWQAIVGAAMMTFEQIIALDMADIEAIVEANRGVGTDKWYAQRALEFQWNEEVRYALVVDENGYARYPAIVSADRIIKQASARLSDSNGLLLKVATTDKDGALCPLTNDQFTDFKNYITSLALPGQPIEFVNQRADTLTVIADVYYSAATNATGLEAELLAALRDFSLDTDFNGRIYRTAVVDALQSVSGVVDVDIKTLDLTDADGKTTAINRVETAAAGYFNISDKTALTLKSEL